MRCVHPSEVDALKRRVGPAIESLGDPTLARDWRDYERRGVDWLDAPRELEHGRDLEARLAWLQGPRSRQPRPRANTGPHAVGETLGYPSVAELKDLLAAKKKEVTEIRAAGAAAMPAWQAAAPELASAWARDMAAADRPFDRASADAQAVIDTVPGMLDEIPVMAPPGEDKSVWDALVEASKPYQDLGLRLAAAGHAPAPYTVPQPKATDVDLHVYKAADRATQVIEEVATKSGGILAVVGLVVGVVLVSRIVRK
jgi:hypothetical protein